MERTAGGWSYRLDGGALRGLAWNGVEVLRGLSAPIRDTEWGTYPEEGADWTHAHDGAGGATHLRRFAVAAGAVTGTLSLDIRATGHLTATLMLAATRAFDTNRAGFTLLHPLAGVVGTDGTAHHPDGSQSPFRFPERISPGQPVMNMSGLSHVVRGVAVTLAMAGDVFEMEDQRNWSDASFKTYCRPLSRPLPQRLAAGETLRQDVTIEVAGTAAPARGAAPDPSTVKMPEILLALEPGWLEGDFAGNAALMRAGAGAVWTDDALARLAARIDGRPLDLEVVTPEDEDPSRALTALATRLSTAGLAPRHVTALPGPFLRSYQPDGPWPDGPSPEDAMASAARAFPHAAIGAGMLTHFTELNRRPLSGGAFLTHGNAAIVHAADDASVLETLEALPDVFGSARALAGDRPVRLGLVAIAMRSNPYGAGLAPNPDGRRMTMTDTDPRQALPFAAAYAVAAAAIAARAGVQAIALGAPGGPFGVTGRPIGAATAALAAMAGREAWISGIPPGPLTIATDRQRITLDAPDALPRLETIP